MRQVPRKNDVVGAQSTIIKLMRISKSLARTIKLLGLSGATMILSLPRSPLLHRARVPMLDTSDHDGHSEAPSQ